MNISIEELKEYVVALYEPPQFSTHRMRTALHQFSVNMPAGSHEEELAALLLCDIANTESDWHPNTFDFSYLSGLHGNKEHHDSDNAWHPFDAEQLADEIGCTEYTKFLIRNHHAVEMLRGGELGLSGFYDFQEALISMDRQGKLEEKKKAISTFFECVDTLGGKFKIDDRSELIDDIIMSGRHISTRLSSLHRIQMLSYKFIRAIGINSFRMQCDLLFSKEDWDTFDEVSIPMFTHIGMRYSPIEGATILQKSLAIYRENGCCGGYIAFHKHKGDMEHTCCEQGIKVIGKEKEQDGKELP